MGKAVTQAPEDLGPRTQPKRWPIGIHFWGNYYLENISRPNPTPPLLTGGYCMMQILDASPVKMKFFQTEVNRNTINKICKEIHTSYDHIMISEVSRNCLHL